MQVSIICLVTNRTNSTKNNNLYLQSDSADKFSQISNSYEYKFLTSIKHQLFDIMGETGYDTTVNIKSPSQYTGSSLDESIGWIQSAENIVIMIRSDHSKWNEIGFSIKEGDAKSKAVASEMIEKFSGYKYDNIDFSVSNDIEASIFGGYAANNCVYVEVSIGHANSFLDQDKGFGRFDSDFPKNSAYGAAKIIADVVLNYLKENGVAPEYTPGGVTGDASYEVAPDTTETFEYDMEMPARPSVQASIGASAETVLTNIHDKQLSLTCDYLVYFDDVCMNDFVLSYNCAIGVDMGIGRASVELVYTPAFHKIKVDTSVTDGIENGTQIRIFMRNVFDLTYRMCFEGIIKQRTLIRDAQGFTLSFSAVDYMYWMNKIIAPISIPLNEAISPGERLKWKAQSVDPQTTANVEITQAGSLKGKTLQKYFDVLKSKSFENSKIYSEPNSVANWDDVVNRVAIMGDINEQLVKDEVIDFVVNSNSVFADTVYVSLSNTTQSLLMEMYQDRDGIVRIKPPFWNEPVLKNHIIDPMMILSAQESTDWNKYYTRIIVTGGVEEWMDSGTTAEKVDLLTPVGVYLGSLTDKNAAKWADYTSEGTLPSSYGGGNVVNRAWDDIVYYSQYDKQWSNIMYGSSSTIGAAGCGPTSLAIVVSTLTGKAVTPPEVCEWSVQNGHRCEGNGSYHSLIPEGAKYYGLSVQGLGRSNATELSEHLAAGRFIIAIMAKGHFTSNGHFIVLRGVTDSGKILVADPASEKRSEEEWDISIILDEARSDAAADGPFWSISY